MLSTFQSNRFWSIVLLLYGITLFNSCAPEKVAVPKDLAQDALIPKPVSLTATGSSFELNAQTTIYAAEGQQKEASYLANLLKPATGFDFPIAAPKESASNAIVLSIVEKEQLGTEGYQLEISEDLIKIEAQEGAGLFYGIQTLRQLLPATIESKTKQDTTWLIATGSIQDQPTYAYRGAMLDVSRHFFKAEDVKAFIDYIAMYKMNRLHLHLSDDQGWRIEIKSWPKLTEIGGSTEVGGGEGGFYTQEQYADLVQYAADRFITVVPEIDMPGHTNAALASYAELNCNGKAPELYTGTKVGFSTLCTSKEVTYQFIDDVIRELAALTPGEYIHIGGDESHVTPLEDYIPFINRVQTIVEKHGKKVIGWDEIAHAELLPNTVVQWWAQVANAKRGIRKGANVLVSPATKAYLDMQYDSTTHLGLHWAAYIEVDSAYIWDLATIADSIQQENIVGIEAPLWSETITNLDEIEYMIFPRFLGHAEIGWSPAAIRNWEDYKVRLGKQKARLDALEIDFYASKLVPWE